MAYKRFERVMFIKKSVFPNKITSYELSPEKVDCDILFKKLWTILKEINKITEKFNTYFHYTITAYEKDIEPGHSKYWKKHRNIKKNYLT